MSAPQTEMRPALPRQIGFIIGNEACERFSFYGMRNVLTQFLATSALLGVVEDRARDAAAKEVFHVFVMGVYFFPLLGGWLSDRFLGKYRTILWLSLVYCLGNACLALFVDDRTGFYCGLFLISLGSGGIKPCVSSFVGEQFNQSNKSLAKVVFDAFYWIINFGSFFASLFIPLVLSKYGPRWAFGVPGVLMFVATIVFWLGRKRYVVEPPGPADPHAFSRVCASAIKSTLLGRGLFTGGIVLSMACASLHVFIEEISWVAALCLGLVAFGACSGIAAWLHIGNAEREHPKEQVEGAKAVLRLLVLFMAVTPFWSLFDQKASTWVLQARGMTMPESDWFKSPSQMQAINPLLVMLLIPFNNVVLYPLLRRAGIAVTALRRMTTGIVFAGLAWIVVGGFQLQLDSVASLRLDHGAGLSIFWQVAPYMLLTFGEVLVSATGLEFAYSQAPPNMKGVLMSCWTLSVTIGSLWVLLVNASVKSPSFTQLIEQKSGVSVTAFQMLFFAAFALAAAALFGGIAKRYTVKDYYRA